MEDIDKLLKRMNALTQRASDSSADLANFICAESIPLGEVIHDWLSSRDSHTVNITHGETEQLIKRRRITTWVKAKRRFKSQELAILADWQALEVRALARILHEFRYKNGGKPYHLWCLNQSDKKFRRDQMLPV